MEYRQNETACEWIYEFIEMPRCGGRTGFSFAIAYDTSHNNIWIIQNHAIGDRQSVAELSAFKYYSGSSWTAMTRKTVWPTEILGDILQTTDIKSRLFIIFD